MGQTVADALATLRDDPAVRLAERDRYSVLHATTNDPLFGQLWGLLNGGSGVDGFLGALPGADVDVSSAWDRTRGSSAIVIADIDSGYRFDAPDLAPVAWTNALDPAGGGDNDGNGIVDDTHGADFVGSSADAPATDGDPTDDNLIDGGHGVHTAGTMGAAGNNGVGISGVAQNVRIMPLRVCAFSSSAGETRCPTSSQILAINYAGAHNARVANMSLGSISSTQAVSDAIAANANVLFVISAGNDAVSNDAVPHYPCNYPLANIVCVAATDQADQLAGFSDWGATSVDLGAPGTQTYSTYPVVSDNVDDDFEVDDFAGTWSNTGGTGFGRANPGDGPLTSFGMSDSPGVAPAPSSVHEITLTTGAAIPAGSGSCTLSGLRYRSAGSGGSFYYQVLSDGVVVFNNTTSTDTGGSALVSFSTVPITGLGGHAVKVRFGYVAGSAPSAANGIWFDDLEVDCYAPLATAPAYGFLDGTSMAAPHVTGAAGLLFSLKPSATVAQVRSALLGSVEAVPSLAGKTVTGGRLDVPTAMELLVPTGNTTPDTEVTSGPSATSSGDATFAFARVGGGAATFKCKLDGGSFATCTSPTTYSGLAVGAHEFQVRAKSGGLVDASPASRAWTQVDPPPVVVPPTIVPPVVAPVVKCVVPKLAGKTLTQATRALKAAHCKLGKVTKPKKKKGKPLPPLVVKSSTPKAGSIHANGAKVNLTLKPKPRKRPRR